MPVVAVVNRKGGSGKSTFATHLAAYAAGRGASVMLADVDRQQSMRSWLRERSAQSPATPRPTIVGHSVDPRAFVRPPAGTDLVVVDTPGGLTGLDLARVVMYADAIVMPICNSIFDRESAAECIGELRLLPRVASGRCRVAAVGMRVDAGPEAAAVLQAWATEQRIRFIGTLRESITYVRCAEQGLTLFDLPAAVVRPDLEQWQPILDWLRPVLQPESVASVAAATGSNEAARTGPATVLPGGSIPARRPAEPVNRVLPGVRAATPAPAASTPMGRLIGALSIPRFLQRTS
jgi:chromosome partitioning protein